MTTLVSERSTPELQYLETRWSSLVSYGLTVRLLHDFLPVDEELNISTVRRTTLEVARRREAELGPEQPISSRAARPSGMSCRGPTCR